MVPRPSGCVRLLLSLLPLLQVDGPLQRTKACCQPVLQKWRNFLLSSRVFLKIFAAYALLTLGSAAVLVAILSSRQREIVVQRVEQRLHDSAVLLRSDTRDDFRDGFDPSRQDILIQLGEETNTRLTLIAENGRVLGDSKEDPVAMENHRERDELLQARNVGFGVSQRPSPTLGIPMMYYALRVGDKDDIVGFVRVSMPMESVNAEVRSVQRLILVNSILVGLVALAITYVIVGRIIRPLATLTQAAKSIASGDIHLEVEVQSRDELGVLAESFNQMSRELAGRIDQLSMKSRDFAENSERLEAVLGGMIDGVLAVDGDQRILFANRAACNLLEFYAFLRSRFNRFAHHFLDGWVANRFPDGLADEFGCRELE